MNRFGSHVVHPFLYQPTRTGLRGLGVSTTSGAAAGASTGAAVGSVVPVVGTAVGAILGAVGGALASAFTRNDKEVGNFDQAVALWQVNPNNVYNIANKYLVLAGLFDLSLKNPHIPIYQRYGRMGEQKFVTDFVQQIYAAAQSGRINSSDTALTIMAKVIQPWIDSWGLGPMNDPHADLINRLMIGMIQDYITGMQTQWHAVGGDYPFGNLPAFSLPAAAMAPAPAPVSTISPVGSTSAAVAPVGALRADIPGTLPTPIGTFASLAGGAFTFQAPGGATQQIALTPSHTGGAGTLSITWNGAQAIATNSDGSTLAFNPSNGSWVSYIGPVNPPAQSSVTPVLPPLTSTPPASTPVVSIPPSTPVATTNTGQTVTQGDLQNLVAQMAAQGQSAQQAYTNALQTLQNSGIQATPQVQSAVQAAVQSTPAPTTAGVSSAGWLGLAAIAGLIFATARPASRPRARKRR